MGKRLCNAIFQDILIVGWKGTESKFKDLLARRIGSKEVNVLFVGNTPQTFSQIQTDYLKILPNSQWKFFKGFSAYANQISKLPNTNFFSKDYWQHTMDSSEYMKTLEPKPKWAVG